MTIEHLQEVSVFINDFRRSVVSSLSTPAWAKLDKAEKYINNQIIELLAE